MKYPLIASFAAILGLFGATVTAQTSPPKTPAKDHAFQATLEKLIQSGTAPDIDKAFDLLKQKFTDNPKQGEPALKDLKNLRATLISQSAHAQDMLDVIAAAKRAKPVKNAAGELNDVGYLWAMQVITLYHMDKPAEAKAAFNDGLFKNLGKQVSGDLIKLWPMVFKAAEKRDEYLALLQTIEMTCWDMETVEQALKRRIEALDEAARPAEALADAKRLFILSTMPHTANAILILDKQLAIADPTKTKLFREEQTQGGAAPKGPADPASPQAAAAANKSTVLLGIKLEGEADKDALEAQGDGTIVDGLLHPAVVYLLIGQPEEALKITTKASPMAVTPLDAASVAAMMARCIKAQDGTVGRANAFMATKPAAPVAAPKSKAPRSADPLLP